jgi:hypothetical protein
MAEIYISHPVQKGTNIVLPFNRWAETALTAEELVIFQAAAARQALVASSNGVEIKHITVGVDGQPKVPVGITMTAPDTEPVFDPEWFQFWERYVNDPSLSWTDKP